MAASLLGKFWAGKLLPVEVSDILTIWSERRQRGGSDVKAYACAIEAFLFEAPLFNTFPESQKTSAFELLELLAASNNHTAHADVIQDAIAAAAKGGSPIVRDATAKQAGWGERVRQHLASKPTQATSESMDRESGVAKEAVGVEQVPSPPGLELPAGAFIKLPPGLEFVEEPRAGSATPVSPFRRRSAGRGRRV
jgi:hypothetical protein